MWLQGLIIGTLVGTALTLGIYYGTKLSLLMNFGINASPKDTKWQAKLKKLRTIMLILSWVVAIGVVVVVVIMR